MYVWKPNMYNAAAAAAAAAKSLQSCPTLCDPIDGSPPGSSVPGILQARTLEWVAISFSSAGKWKGSRSVVSNSSRAHGQQPTRLLRPWDLPGKSAGVGCHCLLWTYTKAHGNLLPLKLLQMESALPAHSSPSSSKKQSLKTPGLELRLFQSKDA